MLNQRSASTGRPRRAMQDRDELRLALGQLALQQLAKEVVVAVPDALSIQRNEEEVGVLDCLELVVGACVLEHGVAERATHPLEHRRPLKETQRAGPQS